MRDPFYASKAAGKRHALVSIEAVPEAHTPMSALLGNTLWKQVRTRAQAQAQGPDGKVVSTQTETVEVRTNEVLDPDQSQELLDGSTGTNKAKTRLPPVKIVGLYFCATWCHPVTAMRGFLMHAYKKHLRAKGLEIVFISMDRDEENARNFFQGAAWPMLPYGVAMSDGLARLWRAEVGSSPRLLLLDARSGYLLDRDGKTRVDCQPTGWWVDELVASRGASPSFGRGLVSNVGMRMNSSRHAHVSLSELYPEEPVRAWLGTEFEKPVP